MTKIIQILIYVMFSPAILFSAERDLLIGVWNWENLQDRRDIKVLFRADGTAVYKISNTAPITAKWQLNGDELIVTSPDFTWDYVYKQIISLSFEQVMENWDDEPFSKGKILDIKGDLEKYRLDEENLTLIPIKNSTSGLLKKEGLTEYEFEKFIPGDCPAGGGRAFYLESELLIPHRPSLFVVKNDSILSQTFDQISKFPKAPITNQKILDCLPEKIDSIEFKFIDMWEVHERYFAIDRKAFDDTFDYLKLNKTNHVLIDIVTCDSTHIAKIVEFFKTLKPFPTEAIKITPYNVWRNSIGFNDTNFGIITQQEQAIDPIETRGKITLFSQNETIVCYCSMFSIDYKNHRYELSPGLFNFLFYSVIFYAVMNQ